MKLSSKFILLLVCMILSGCGAQRESVSISDKRIEVLNREGTYDILILSDVFSLDALEGCRTTYDKLKPLTTYVSTSPMFLAFGDGKEYNIYGAHPTGTTVYNTISGKKLLSDGVLLEVRDGKLVYTYDLPEYDDSTVFVINTVKDKNLTLLGFRLTQEKKEDV